MELLPKNISFVNGAYWLIKIRWIAVLWVIAATITAKIIFNIQVFDFAFYCIGFTLIAENIISLILLKLAKKQKKQDKISVYIKGIINFQISLDLLFLTVLIHYSGGIENLIFIFFVFHMVISSIILSNINSYLQTTYALILLWTLAFLEYYGIINHYDLWLRRETGYSLYRNKSFLIETLTIFTITSYALVYMSNYIVALLRKREKAYHEANVQLQLHDKIKDEYIIRVTHNIKGHLAAIQTNLSVIINNVLGPVDDQKMGFINTTYTRTIKLSNFVNDLLKLTQMRLEDKPEIETFSLTELINTVISNQKSYADFKRQIIKSVINNEAIFFSGNRVSIEELFSNLLENAIKYTSEGGIIELNVINRKDDVIIEVSDTGIGISENDLPNIFNEFFRADNAKKFIKDGTGLGLAMSKYIVQRYGGSITVTSKEGEGSKFNVILPKNYSETVSSNKK